MPLDSLTAHAFANRYDASLKLRQVSFNANLQGNHGTNFSNNANCHLRNQQVH